MAANTDKKPTRCCELNTETRTRRGRRAGTLMYMFTHVDRGAQDRGTGTDPVVPRHRHPSSFRHQHSESQIPRQAKANTGSCSPSQSPLSLSHTHTHTQSHPSQDVNSTAGLTIPTPGVTQGPGRSDRHRFISYLVTT